MWETFSNAWRIPDLRKKILYTLFMLLIYRLLTYVPCPNVDITKVQAMMGEYDLFQYMNLMTGAAIDRFTIMAMGITPYINSSIIMQLLTVAIPYLEELQKEGDEGRKKIAQYTRYVTVALGFVQAIALTMGMGVAADRSTLSYLTIGISLAAGTTLAMWLGERIDKNGIGNGVSLLIFSGIIARIVPAGVEGTREILAGILPVWIIIPVVLFVAILVTGVVFVDKGERRIPVQYAKRVVGRKMYGGQSTHIPLKVNSSGVLPLIFTSAIVMFPPTILQMVSRDAYSWWQVHVPTTGVLYQLVYAALIVAFTFFYSSISFNPVEIAKNMQQNGGMIPGIRQGKPTSDFLARATSRLTLFCGLFLALLAVIPTIATSTFKVHMPFAASSLLIAVSVALETTRAMESQMVMRHYKGFLG